MSAIAEVGTPTLSESPHRFRGTLELAHFEGRRALRNPFLALAAFASALLFVLLTKGLAPVLQRDETFVGLALMPVALTVLIAYNFAALRSTLDDAEEVLEPAPASREDRRIGLLLSLTYPVAVSMVLAAAMILYLLARGAVGSLDAFEILVAPAEVAFFGAAGVLLARCWRSPAGAPLAAAAVAAAQLYFSAGLVDSFADAPRSRWLLPWVPLSVGGHPAGELVVRPAGWHLLWLVALAALLALGAIGIRGRKRPRIALLVTTAVIASVAARAETAVPAGAEIAHLRAVALNLGDYQRCTHTGAATYCAYREYAGLTPHWETAVDGVVRALPAAVQAPRLRVRQVLETTGSDLPTTLEERFANRWQSGGRDRLGAYFDDLELYAGTEWRTGAGEGAGELALALGSSAWAVGLPPTPKGLQGARPSDELMDTYVSDAEAPYVQRQFDRASFSNCAAVGQGRAIVALWLAGQATPAAGDALRRVPLRSSAIAPVGELGPEVYLASGDAVAWGAVETRYALRLLQEPHETVERALAERWADLVRPTTTTAEAAEILGLESVPDPGPVDYRRLGSVPCP